MSVVPHDVALGVLVSAILPLELTQSGPTGADWTSPVPYIDRPLRAGVVASSRNGREQAALSSNWLGYANIAY